MLDEELEGEELDVELAPVTLQLALVAARLGRHSEAASAHQVGAHAFSSGVQRRPQLSAEMPVHLSALAC